MKIDLTLLVQIIHVIVAYIIIERLLLRRLFEAYCHDRQQKQDALSDVDASEHALRVRDHAKTEQWDGLRRAFQHEVPTRLKQRIASTIDMTPHAPDVSPAQVRETVDDVKSRIFKRLMP